jgi:hypothetical protein
MRTTTVLTTLVLLGACNSDHTLGAIDPDASTSGVTPYGDTQAGGGGASGAGPVVTLGADAAVDTLGALGPVQSWTGWVENYQFPSGSDALKLSFAVDESGNLVGHITMGSGSPPPPATDPNVGYPPGYAPMSMPLGWEGFPFSMLNGKSTTNRLRFTMNGLEPWAGWCALQTPVDDSGFCLPNWGSFMNSTSNYCEMYSSDSPPKTITVDCGKLELCNHLMVCVCSATSCTLNANGVGSGTTFDLAVAGDIASGSGMVGGDTRNVHFTKDP